MGFVVVLFDYWKQWDKPSFGVEDRELQFTDPELQLSGVSSINLSYLLVGGFCY